MLFQYGHIVLNRVPHHSSSVQGLEQQPRKDLVVSQNRGPQYRPQNIIILIIGTPKKVPIILVNFHLEIHCTVFRIQGSGSKA